MKIGYIGLGKMGKNMVLRLLSQNIKVVAWNRSPEPVYEVAKQGAKPSKTLKELANNLPRPRIIWLMLSAGNAVDSILTKLIPLLDPGDLIIDGGNSYYKDTLKRAKLLQKNHLRFLDVGVSGGPDGALTGACLMVGGNKEDYDRIEPLLVAASAPRAYSYLGKNGAGHFVKMVHNGIEYGMMEAIAEGAAILKKSPFRFDLNEIMKLYNTRSVIESRLIGWTGESFKKDPDLKAVSSEIGYTGEGGWTVKTAKELGVVVPAIAASLRVRKNSQNEPENFRNKVVSVLRGKFGRHDIKKH